MATSLDDLQPKPYKVSIRGTEIECQPPRLAHILSLSKMGDVLQHPKDYTFDEITQTEKDLNRIFAQLMPALKGKTLGFEDTIELITSVMNGVQPTEDKELADKKIELNPDKATTKKAEGAG